jgi:FixJ family two-component response regulator
MDADIPIVFISGHGDISMAVGAIKRGAVDFVPKPYQEQHLLDAVNEALRRDALARAAPRSAPVDLPSAWRGSPRANARCSISL